MGSPGYPCIAVSWPGVIDKGPCYWTSAIKLGSICSVVFGSQSLRFLERTREAKGLGLRVHAHPKHGSFAHVGTFLLLNSNATVPNPEHDENKPSG